MVNFDIKRRRVWNAKVVGKVRAVPAEYLKVVGRFKVREAEEIYVIQGRVKKPQNQEDSEIEILDDLNPENK